MNAINETCITGKMKAQEKLLGLCRIKVSALIVHRQSEGSCDVTQQRQLENYILNEYSINMFSDRSVGKEIPWKPPLNSPYIKSEGVMTAQLQCLALRQEATRLSIALDFCQMSLFVSSGVIRNPALSLRKPDFSLHTVSYGSWIVLNMFIYSATYDWQRFLVQQSFGSLNDKVTAPVLMVEKEKIIQKNGADAALAVQKAIPTFAGCWDTKCREGNKVTWLWRIAFREQSDSWGVLSLLTRYWADTTSWQDLSRQSLLVLSSHRPFIKDYLGKQNLHQLRQRNCKTGHVDAAAALSSLNCSQLVTTRRKKVFKPHLSFSS